MLRIYTLSISLCIGQRWPWSICIYTTEIYIATQLGVQLNNNRVNLHPLVYHWPMSIHDSFLLQDHEYSGYHVPS